jgi:hypothetical protein
MRLLLCNVLQFILPLMILFTPGLSKGQDWEQHPGAPFTREDLDTSKKRAVAGQQPWADARANLLQEADQALTLASAAVPKKLVIPRRYADASGHMKAREGFAADAWAAQALALGVWMTDDKAKSDAYAKGALKSSWLGRPAKTWEASPKSTASRPW